MFCKASINLHGFSVKPFSEQPSLSALFFTDNAKDTEPALLDIRPKGKFDTQKSPLPAYVINPDYYSVLSDLVSDITDAINKSKGVFNPVFIDYDNAQITVL